MKISFPISLGSGSGGRAMHPSVERKEREAARARKYAAKVKPKKSVFRTQGRGR